MSVDTRTEYTPGDPVLIKNIVAQLKSQGVFDQFRKECISDVDTKPAYKNLCHRVDGQVSSYLDDTRWLPDLNKNQLRENIRKYVNECHFVEPGIARIVDQLVNPRINTVLVPKVEDMVYKYVGIRREESSSPRDPFRHDKRINDNRSKNDILNDTFDISNSRSDKPKAVDNSIRKNSSENFYFENNSRQASFVKNMEDHLAKRSSYNEDKINDYTLLSSNIKIERVADVSECEKSTKPPIIDYFEGVKLEETRTYSNIESDEEDLDDDDLSPPFELHGKSEVDTPASVDSCYSAEVCEPKASVKEEVDNISSIKTDHEETVCNNSACPVKEECVESNLNNCSYASEDDKPSAIVPAPFDVPKTPTINYETSDDSDDNNFLKQSSAASSQDAAGDRPLDAIETDVPDFSNVDKIAQRIVEDNRQDKNGFSSDELPAPVDCSSVDKVIDDETSGRCKENDRDDGPDKRKRDTDKSNWSKTSDSSAKDSRHRDKKHSDHKKDKEKHRSDKRDGGRSDKDRGKSSKDKDKSNHDSSKSKSGKERTESRDKSRKSSDDQDKGNAKTTKTKDESQSDRSKGQRSHGGEKKSKEKEDSKPAELSGKPNSAGDKRSREEKSKEKRPKSEDAKEEKKKSGVKSENEKETKTGGTAPDDDSSERKNKNKKNENSGAKKGGKSQCGSEEKKARTDRRSSDRDSSGPPSSSSHHSHHRGSSKTEKERHTDKSKCNSTSSSTSHKSKKNDDGVKGSIQVLDELKPSTVRRNSLKHDELLDSSQITVKTEDESCSDSKDKLVADNGRLNNLLKSTKSVGVDDTRLEMMLQSIHGQNEINFKNSFKGKRKTEPGGKSAPGQPAVNRLKRRFEGTESRTDNEEQREKVIPNGDAASDLKPHISTFMALGIKKPKIARNEFEFGKVVKLRKLYKERMRALQEQGKENANYAESENAQPKPEEHEERSASIKHPPVNASPLKDTVDYVLDPKCAKYGVNGTHLGKRELVKDSVAKKIKQVKLNITRVDKCYKIVNGTCLISDDESQPTATENGEVDANKRNADGEACGKNVVHDGSDTKKEAVEEQQSWMPEGTETERSTPKKADAPSSAVVKPSSKKKRVKSVNARKRSKSSAPKEGGKADVDSKSNVPSDVLNRDVRPATVRNEEIKNETDFVGDASDEPSPRNTNALSNPSYAVDDDDINEEFNDGCNLGDEETLREINIEDIIGCPTNITRITYESDFTVKCKTDKCDASDDRDSTADKPKNTHTLEQSNEPEKVVTVYDENNKENMESKSMQCLSELLQAQRKNVVEEVFYLESGSANDDFKKFVEEKLQESEVNCLQNFSIDLRYSERYDAIFQNQLGAVVKRNGVKSSAVVENTIEILHSPVKYNSEIVNHKVGDEKGIMLRIKMFHEPESPSLNSDDTVPKKKKTTVSRDNKECNKLISNNRTSINADRGAPGASPECNNAESKVAEGCASSAPKLSDLKLTLSSSDTKNSSPVDATKSNRLRKNDAATGTAKRKTLGIKRKLSTTPRVTSANKGNKGSSNNAKARNATDEFIAESKVNAVVLSEPSGTISLISRLVGNASLSESDANNADNASSPSTSNNVIERLVPPSEDSGSRGAPNSSASIESTIKKGSDGSDGNAVAESIAQLPPKKTAKGQRRNSLIKVPGDLTPKDIVPKRTSNQTKCYYDNSDLYKPRPSFLLTTRRSRALNNENTK